MALDTVVHHVCEKTSGLIVHIPDVNAVYQQILLANNGKYENVLLLPEYNAHEDWAEELAWISANFGGVDGIPVMLDVFGGGSGESPTPQLITEQIGAALAVANVKWLRFSEVISWYLEHAQPFPTEYLTTVLNFCRANNLKLYWCEWKIDYLPSVETFKSIQTYIAGFEDLVYVGFKTNSGDLEPAKGFEYIRGLFAHWGGTVESWYWETRHRSGFWEPSSGLGSPDNMPISWMVRHSAEAKEIGAELVQFEPYWYFFSHDTGKANDYLRVLHYFLNSHMTGMDACSVVLQTLKAEWINGPGKGDVAWLDGRASTVTAWDIEPSSFDFKSLPKKYAVSCYSLGGSSVSGKLWLKSETVGVDVLVKTLGTTFEKAALVRESMRVEVERILHMYCRVGPFWDPAPGPTGAYKHRRVPGFRDVVIAQVASQSEDSSVARVTVRVQCRPERFSWVRYN